MHPTGLCFGDRNPSAVCSDATLKLIRKLVSVVSAVDQTVRAGPILEPDAGGSVSVNDGTVEARPDYAVAARRESAGGATAI